LIIPRSIANSPDQSPCSKIEYAIAAYPFCDCQGNFAVIETHQPDHSPPHIGARLQAEIKRQQQFDTSPSAPLGLRISTRQAQIGHIGLILDAASQKAQPRATLPGKLQHWPIIRLEPVQRVLFKLYNFLFKEQRTAQMATIQAVRESTKLHQQMLDQTQSLEEFQQGLHHAVSHELAQIEQRLSHLENRFDRSEVKLQQIQLPESQINRSIQSLTDRLSQLEQTVQQLDAAQSERLRLLRSDVSHQKHLLDQISQLPAPSRIGEPLAVTATNPQSAKLQQFDGFYSTFEDQFRGSRAAILERLERYLPLIGETNLAPQAKIIDLGCGRGEWLELLQTAGYAPIGVDLNRLTLEQCTAQQLTVIQADALTYLQSLPDQSVAAVTGFHIIEHLPFDMLTTLVAEAFRVIQPGGFVLFETPNPRNLLVSGFSFYLDPTHRNPIPSEVMQFLLRYTGFEPVVPLWVNPSDLPKVSEDSELGRRFNELFYGFMDYAVMGLKG
jgi:2-polyprenyl-3-methyl-5-hydroxy-6-metoxy-1,4-benzoquinol methylase